MICVHSTKPVPPSASLISMSECVERFGVCAETLRRWDASGKITSYRVNARSHRRFDPREIAQAMGLEVKSEENKGAIPVCYCRTSSQSQLDSLRNQVSRARTEVSALEGIAEKDVVIYQECKSAFSSREKLNELTEHIIMGKISKVYVIWLDRLGRDGVLELFKSICKTRNVEIIIIEQDECSDSEEVKAGLQECMNYLQVVINRRMGKRGGQKVMKTMSQETLELCYSMYKNGESLRTIESELEKKGIKDQDGKLYKRGVIQNRIAENLKALQVLNNDQPQNDCVEFLQKYVKKSRGKKSTARASIARAWKTHCEKNHLMMGSASHLTKSIDKVFPNVVRTKNKYREVFYGGLVLTINKGGK